MFKRVAISILLAFSITMAKSTFGASGDLTTIIEGALLGDSMVTTGNGNIFFTYTRVDSTSARAQTLAQKALSETPPGGFLVRVNYKEINLSFAFSGPRVRCDERSIDLMPNGNTFTRHWQSAYNGEKMDFLRLDGIGSNDLVVPIGSIRNQNIILTDKFDPRYHAMSMLGVPIATFLQGTAKEGLLQDVKLTGEGVQDSITYKIVEATVANSGISYKVWLAPERMYRPIHFEVKTDSTMKVVQNRFKEFSSGVWFPKEVIVEDYYLITGKPVLEERTILSIFDDFSLNTEVSDTVFQIDFPTGLMVYDWRTGSSFKIK